MLFPFVQISLTIIFLPFFDEGLELITTKLLVFAFLFFLVQNAHRVVHELLAVIYLNLSRLRENIEFFMNF